MFLCEFCKSSKNIYRALPNDCFLSLSVNFEQFFRTSLLQSTSEKLFKFHVQVAVFQPADTVKNYFTGAIQAFYTRTRKPSFT